MTMIVPWCWSLLTYMYCTTGVLIQAALVKSAQFTSDVEPDAPVLAAQGCLKPPLPLCNSS